MNNAQDVFREEAYELLEELSSSLLELEEDPDNNDLVGGIFRALHTIKGSGAMFGFDELSAFVHDIENIYDMIRDGKMSVSKKLVDLTLASCDTIRAMVSPDREGFDADIKKQLEDMFRQMLPAGPEQQQNGSVDEPQQAAGGARMIYRIYFRPHADIFMCGTNPILLLNELRDMGDCTVIAKLEDVPSLEELNPEENCCAWDIILTTDQGINAIKDVFIFVEDSCELKIDTIAESSDIDDDEHKRLGEILIERGNVSPEALREALAAQKKLGQVLVDSGTVAAGEVESALAEQEHIRKIRNDKKQFESASSIRVAADRIDALVDLVGEMVTVQARLSQTASQLNSTELSMVAEEVERLTAELRDNTMSIRMLPIGTTFSKFKRVVRDLSAELSKEVVLVTEGAETELDKTVIERLGDPLMHLIRNSIDHGIEQPGVREAAGKSPQGTVKLSANHSGAFVVITITDDGAGLDRDAIHRRAVERGLLKADVPVSDREVFECVLAPGFSTAREVTNISGRGVGMDVVRQNIDALRGTIDVSSERGRGTTVTLKLPLTLAIIDGLLVKVADDYFILPLSVVEECVELTRRDVEQMHGKNVASVRGSLVPYINLRDLFSVNGDRPPIEQIAICSVEEQRIGFVVDDVIGGHQTVIKNLGRMYRNVEGLSGATILGDGNVALILDPVKLSQQVEQKAQDLC